MLDEMFRPGMKADWASSIRVGRIPLSLEARIPLIHLYIMLQQEIGLKSLKDEGFGTLGTRVKAVWFNSLSNLPVLKKCNTA